MKNRSDQSDRVNTFNPLTANYLGESGCETNPAGITSEDTVMTIKPFVTSRELASARNRRKKARQKANKASKRDDESWYDPQPDYDSDITVAQSATFMATKRGRSLHGDDIRSPQGLDFSPASALLSASENDTSKSGVSYGSRAIAGELQGSTSRLIEAFASLQKVLEDVKRDEASQSNTQYDYQPNLLKHPAASEAEHDLSSVLRSLIALRDSVRDSLSDVELRDMTSSVQRLEAQLQRSLEKFTNE
jgi:hypothetical protein